MDKEVHAIFNPLEICKVLQQVLHHLDIPNLKKCRLVNSAWNHEAVLLLRKNDCLLFNRVKDFSKFIQAYEFEEGIQQRTFLPYKSCILGSELLEPENPEYIAFSEAAGKFFQHFGPYFTALHLNLGTSVILDTALGTFLQNILFSWMTNLSTLSVLLKDGPYDFLAECDSKLPNLNHIHIQWVGCFNQKGNQDHLENFVSRLFQCGTNLTLISCRLPSFVPNFVAHKDLRPSVSDGLILKSIISLQEPLKNLRHLDVILNVNSEILIQVIAKLGRHIETINLKFEKSVDTQIIQDLCRRKLRNLHVDFGMMDTFSDFGQALQTSKLETLESLGLTKSRGSLRFLNYLPCLNQLELDTLNLSSSSVSICNEILKYLHISEALLDPNLGISISHSFPHVSHLRIQNIDNVSLRSVLGHLTSLVSLDISGSNLSDEGICGESDNILRLLLESTVEEGQSQCSWNFNPRYPCISDLKCLQELCIVCDLISDASLLFGISRCKKLKRLHIQSRLELITVFGLAKLKELHDLEDLRIYVRNRGWSSLKELRGNRI